MARKGTITDEDTSFTEQWENIACSSHDVIRLDSRGDEEHELIAGQRKFMITTEERLITQECILDPKNDPFKNGCFRPIVVPDSVTVESNLNALSDDEIRSILTSSNLAWEGWMETLDSPQTLARMVEIADRLAEDSSANLSLARYKQLNARLEQVKPKRRITQKDQAQYDAMDRSRSGTGRSSDYRRPRCADSSYTGTLTSPV